MVVAVDPDTGREQRWEDITVWDPQVDEQDQARLARALRETSVLREAIFLFSGGATVRLNDIVPQGVHVRPEAVRDGRSTLRVTIETRYYGVHDVAVALNRTLTAEEIDDEALWSILAGEPREGERLAPEFGGLWPEHGLWTEEYVGGESAARLVERLSAAGGDAADPRLGALGPFLVWSAAAAFIEFWDRTGRALALKAPNPDRVVAPAHDYHIGPRLTSVAGREPFVDSAQMLAALDVQLVGPLATMCPPLRGAPSTRLLCSALLEVVGVESGLTMLEVAARTDQERGPEYLAFVSEVRARGFVERRLHFAIERYRRWESLAQDATREAKAFTLRQLRDTYHLIRVYERRPEARTRFFRETVLRGASGALGEGLDALVEGLARGQITPDQLPERLDSLRLHAAPASDDEYFMIRLSWPHVRPGDAAQFISLERGGVRQSDVVMTREDSHGRLFLVRRPLSPREVGELQRLFLAERLPVSFRSDHHFLVAVEVEGRLIGGLFYELDAAAKGAYLEKIVVAESHRRSGVSQALMQEFLHRLQDAGVRLATTGFFRPEYFAHFGFKVDRAYGGQVKLLDESPAAP